MASPISLQQITIRKALQPGDIGYIIHLHGKLYYKEFNYGPSFESYVAKAFHEFYQQYDQTKDSVWVAEYNGKIVGFLSLMHRLENMAQLRFFIIDNDYRGIGLGKHLVELFMIDLKGKQYKGCYLWTSKELETAMSLYQRHGFVLIEERQSTTFGVPMTEQRYELML